MLQNESDFMNRDYTQVQIVTVQDLFDQREPQIPPLYSPFRLAERLNKTDERPELFSRSW